MYFIFGIILSFFLSFLWNHDRRTYDIKYKESVAFHEKKVPKGFIPLFIQPTGTDRKNFITYRNKKYFTNLMIRYLYVPVEEEGILYALLTSNQFNIKEAGYYIDTKKLYLHYKEKSDSILIRKSLPLTNKDNKNQ